MNRTVLFSGAITLAASATASADLVNGNFSAGMTGWTWTPDANSEPTMTPSVVAGPFGSGPAFRVNPGNANGDGSDRGGILSQSIVLTAGVNYTVSGILGIQNVSGSPNADGGTITVSLGGTLLHTFDVQAINAGTLFTDPFSAPFTPGVTGPAAFEVHFTRNFPNFVSSILHWGDTFSIVPAPGTLGAMMLGSLALLRRRR